VIYKFSLDIGFNQISKLAIKSIDRKIFNDLIHFSNEIIPKGRSTN